MIAYLLTYLKDKLQKKKKHKTSKGSKTQPLSLHLIEEPAIAD